jgi:hypothetical protein
MDNEELQKLIDERVLEVLRNNLRIEVETGTSYECERMYYNLSIDLKFGNETIDTHYVSMNAG